MVLGVALLAAIVLGGLLGMWIIRDSGYVMISYGQTAVETSLWVAIAGRRRFVGPRKSSAHPVNSHTLVYVTGAA